MTKITNENHREIYESLKDFYIQEIETFSDSHGGPTKAAEKIQMSRHVIDQCREKGIEALCRIYEKCVLIGYDIKQMIDFTELSSRTKFTRDKINQYIKEGKFIRLGENRYDRKTAEIIIAELEERRRISGIK